MQDRLRRLLTRLKEWWDKFTVKQKTLIISVAAAVIIGISIFVWALSVPQYRTLVICETPKETSEVRAILDEDGTMDYRIKDDGLTIEINRRQYSDATIMLGANDIPAEGYDPEKIFSGGFSTTEADKEKRYKMYLQSHIAQDLETQDNIAHATVNLSIPEDTGTLLDQKKESYASVMLKVKNNDEMTDDVASGIARFVATAIGNDSTANIVIMDTEGRMLFTGENDASSAGSASNRLSFKTKYDDIVKSAIRNALVGSKIYDNVQVVPNLNIDWSNTDTTEHTYRAPEGQDQGVLSHQDTYSQTAENTGGQVPGTDTNGDNTYVYADNENSTTTTDETSLDYLPDEKITQTKAGGGNINYETSSIGITAIKYTIYNEALMRETGLLDGTTFAEFKAANSERTKAEVDQDVIGVVSRATGIPVANIQIVAYNEPVFVEDEGNGILSWQNILMVLLILLILGLLAFVVIRSMRAERREGEQQEQELSLDNLLQSSQSAALDDIEMDEKSEARLLIEKFVDENPEAVANLLRNWLSEDW